MLQTIDIENFAIIDKLNVTFAAGLNIFTGETGAGKSIIIEALGFVLGERGDSGLIKEGQAKMSVSAAFSTNMLPKNIADKYKIIGTTFTLKRELDGRGKNRAWVNNNPALVADLALIGSDLVDFHGQHEHQALFKNTEHLHILDTFADLAPQANEFHALYKQKIELENKIAATKMTEAEKEKLLSLYQYQLAEIEKISPLPNEDIELETVLPKLKNAGKLQEYAQEAHALLSAMDGAAAELLAKAQRLVGEMAEQDATLQGTDSELKTALTVVEDIAQTLSSYASNIDADPQTLDNMLTRQENLRKLKHKYGPQIEDVLITKQHLQQDIGHLQTSTEQQNDLQQKLKDVQIKLAASADVLTDKRLGAAKKLGELVVQQIAPLGFDKVRFAVDLQQAGSIGPHGQDLVEFLFSSNPGQSLKPLRNIASGGEASRLMLGLKTVLASGTPVMVFDEIDTGISGHTGKLVGAKLKQVSCGRQVLCVTHLAQAAVYGAVHFSVTKIATANGTDVLIEEIKGVKKVKEIARMIGSSDNAASAGYSHARELLTEAGSDF